MSDCIGAPAHQWLEGYIEGTLPEDEALKFEEHYFECPACLAEVQALQAAQEQLRRHPVTVAPRRRVLSWPAMVSFGALAAALAIGLITLRMTRHNPQPADTFAVTKPAPAAVPSPSQSGQPQQQIAQLADLHLPSYHAPTLRGGSEDSDFQRGMQQYASGDCAQASQTLAQVDHLGPDRIAALFYSGVCRMHTGDLAGAANKLHRVISSGESPQLESAWYYLAQIALARSDATEARQDLARVISLHGDLEDQARKQLTLVPQRSTKK